eukprot:6367330-Amphidinium_carterae.1
MNECKNNLTGQQLQTVGWYGVGVRLQFLVLTGVPGGTVRKHVVPNHEKGIFPLSTAGKHCSTWRGLNVA